MRTARALLGEHWLSVWMPETLEERERGLQGFAPLADGEGMLFPGASGVAMKSVAFPIDVLFLRAGRVAYVKSLWPGDARVWALPGVTAILELPIGWALRHDVDVGAPLFIAG